MCESPEEHRGNWRIAPRFCAQPRCHAKPQPRPTVDAGPMTVRHGPTTLLFIKLCAVLRPFTVTLLCAFTYPFCIARVWCLIYDSNQAGGYLEGVVGFSPTSAAGRETDAIDTLAFARRMRRVRDRVCAYETDISREQQNMRLAFLGRMSRVAVALVPACTFCAGAAFAQANGLALVGATNPANGFPQNYQDKAGVGVEQCLDVATAGDLCGLVGGGAV